MDVPKNVLQVRSLPTVANTVIDDLTVNLVGGNVNERHMCQLPLIAEEQIDGVFD